MSWGVMGDWNNFYTTMHPNFVKEQLWAFLDLYEAGVVNRRYMPVYWSPKTQTALAESELEYNKEHVSQSVYVRFEVCNPGEIFSIPSVPRKKLYLLVWTTTPWTLIANKAICVNCTARYGIIENSEAFYIVAEELIQKNKHLEQIFQNSKVVSTVTGEKLQHLRYIQPLQDILEDSNVQGHPVFVGKHVTLDAGTGLVHTAPAHGQDDYIVGISNNLNLSCQVNFTV
jgi:isoleucyl-tRNA synthetase